MPKPPRFAPSPVRVVELLTFPLVQLLDVTGPAQVFASANDFVLTSGGLPPYELKVVAQGGAQVTASAGLKLSTQSLPLEDAAVDTLMVAGGCGHCDRRLGRDPSSIAIPSAAITSVWTGVQMP